MQKLEIQGGNKLFGTVKISGSKNATLPILAATILTDKKVIIHNVPLVRDVTTMITLLDAMGSKVKFNTKEKKI
jgi:UDP-N-acetylglucosamine 1-carboxyvinyltransferase